MWQILRDECMICGIAQNDELHVAMYRKAEDGERIGTYAECISNIQQRVNGSLGDT